MTRKKRVPATLEGLQAQIEALQRQVAAQTPPAAPETSLTELRRRLKVHRDEMRMAPGGLIGIEDERTERLLLRAIEIAKAPKEATMHRGGDLERGDGITNASLSGADEEEDQ